MADLAVLNDLGLTRQPQTTSSSPSNGAIQQEAFLELMIAQFRNQDPFKPMENGDFLGQLAQFGTVSGIEDLQDSFASFADSLYSDQALQASGLIGREVLIPASGGILGATGGIRGAAELPTATASMMVQITDASGQLVRRMDLGVQEAGLNYFDWDGLNDLGQRVAPGAYQVEVVAGAGRDAGTDAGDAGSQSEQRHPRQRRRRSAQPGPDWRDCPGRRASHWCGVRRLRDIGNNSVVHEKEKPCHST